MTESRRLCNTIPRLEKSLVYMSLLLALLDSSFVCIDIMFDIKSIRLTRISLFGRHQNKSWINCEALASCEEALRILTVLRALVSASQGVATTPDTLLIRCLTNVLVIIVPQCRSSAFSMSSIIAIGKHGPIFPS